MFVRLPWVRTPLGRELPAGMATTAARLALGFAALLAGFLLYETGRPATAAYWTWCAPMFIHVVAMVMLIAAVRPPTTSGAVRLCASWVAINAVFEMGQQPSLARPVAAALESGCGPIVICHRTANYFLRGTFDPLDLWAAVAGGFAAWGLLRLTASRERRS